MASVKLMFGGQEVGTYKLDQPTVVAGRDERCGIHIDNLGIAKTSNLQPYLFRVLQEQDAGAEVTIVVEVNSAAGIPADVLEKRIAEAFDQLGITVRWEAS